MRTATFFRRPRPTRRAQARKARLQVEALEVRTAPSIDIHNGFDGLDWASRGPDVYFGGPPDVIAAAGPNHLVEMINSSIAFFDKTTGTKLFQQSLNDFFAPNQPIGGLFILFDPYVVYDEQAGRFVLGALEVNQLNEELSYFHFAVSNTADPRDGFREMHKIEVRPVVGGAAASADIPRIGWNADAYVVSFFTIPFSTALPGGAPIRILTLDKSTVLDADPATLRQTQVDRPGGAAGNFVMAPARMHGSMPGDPLWFVQSRAAFVNTLRVTRMTNVLSASPTFVDFDVPVAPYAPAPFATQPGGKLIEADFQLLLLSTAWRDNRLVAVHTADGGDAARVRWYELDTAGATPALAQSGRIDQGPGVHTHYSAIDIAVNGDLGLMFLQSSPSEFLSVYVTGQKAADPRGVMRPPVRVRAGQATYEDFLPSPLRGSDFSGISVDPLTGTSFWSAGEYATAPSGGPNYGSWIANFSLAEPAGAWVTGSNPRQALVAPSVDSFTFRFSEPMDPASFAPAEDVVSFTGPGGTDLRGQLTGFTWMSATQLQVRFTAQAAPGPYTLVLGPAILRASDGRPLDQNGNGTPGEKAGDQYTASFSLNRTGPDGFGYTASVHPFEAIDLVPGAPGVVSILTNANDASVIVDLSGNTFTFYGTVYSSLIVGTNGVIGFGAANNVAANTNLVLIPLRAGISWAAARPCD